MQPSVPPETDPLLRALEIHRAHLSMSESMAALARAIAETKISLSALQSVMDLESSSAYDRGYALDFTGKKAELRNALTSLLAAERVGATTRAL